MTNASPFFYNSIVPSRFLLHIHIILSVYIGYNKTVQIQGLKYFG